MWRVLLLHRVHLASQSSITGNFDIFQALCLGTKLIVKFFGLLQWIFCTFELTQQFLIGPSYDMPRVRIKFFPEKIRKNRPPAICYSFRCKYLRLSFRKYTQVLHFFTLAILFSRQSNMADQVTPRLPPREYLFSADLSSQFFIYTTPLLIFFTIYTQFFEKSFTSNNFQ